MQPVSKHAKKKKKSQNTDSIPEIEGLDTQAAIQLLGNATFYMEILKDYYQLIDSKTAILKESLLAEDWNRYTIEVHALKSSSKQIGAMELSGIAAELEAAGKNMDLKYIQDNNDFLLDKYHALQDILRNIFPDTPEETPKESLEAMPKDLLLDSFLQIEDAISNLDTDALENIIQQLNQYHHPPKHQKIVTKLAKAVDGFDFETCEQLLAEWKTLANPK